MPPVGAMVTITLRLAMGYLLWDSAVLFLAAFALTVIAMTFRIRDNEAQEPPNAQQVRG
jgi:hypothetical protein